MTIDDDRLSATAATLVDAVTGLAPAAEAAATVRRDQDALTRFANSAIHQNVDEDTVSVRLQVHLDGRTVSLRFGAEAADDPGHAADAAIAAVRSGPLDPSWPGLAPGASAPEPASVADHQIEPGRRADAVGAFVDAAGGLVAAGYCRTVVATTAFANSASQALIGRTSEAAIDGIARHGGVDGVARDCTNGLDDLDPAALGRLAAAKARRGIDADELPAGRYEVVLEPAAVADIVSNLSFFGFNGRAVLDGASFVRPGEDQFDASISMDDDAPAAGIVFDTEGTPCPRRAFVERGATRAVAHDRRTGAEAGTESTGHASGSAAFGALALHLGIRPDESRLDPSRLGDEVVHPSAVPLVADVEDGLLVSDFWYTRVLDPRALSITGLTRNGVWRIRDGQVAGPVRNFRFTQAYPAALAPGAVIGVGPVAVSQPEGWMPARWRTPALHLRSWNFTGTASG